MTDAELIEAAMKNANFNDEDIAKGLHHRWKENMIRGLEGRRHDCTAEETRAYLQGLAGQR